MRHAKKFNHLGRKTAHRKAMLENMSASLIMSKRIFTTTAKAKALRVYLEPVITKSKTNSTHSRRTAFSYLGSNITAKNATKELFDVIAPKIGERPGGYLRIIKTGFRAGDSAEMSMIEFVDFNDTYTQTGTETKKKATRRRGGKKSAATAEISAPSTEETSTPEEGSEETKAE